MSTVFVAALPLAGCMYALLRFVFRLDADLAGVWLLVVYPVAVFATLLAVTLIAPLRARHASGRIASPGTWRRGWSALVGGRLTRRGRGLRRSAKALGLGLVFSWHDGARVESLVGTLGGRHVRVEPWDRGMPIKVSTRTDVRPPEVHLSTSDTGLVVPAAWERFATGNAQVDDFFRVCYGSRDSARSVVLDPGRVEALRAFVERWGGALDELVIDRGAVQARLRRPSMTLPGGTLAWLPHRQLVALLPALLQLLETLESPSSE